MCTDGVESRPTVLIVDDDAFNRQGLRQYLSLCSFATLEAGDQSTAWALAQAHRLQAAIIDLAIPNEPGMRARPGDACTLRWAMSRP